ncbi:NADH-ubiquinone oxidoreductase chain J [Arcticibacter svalbardensis MN12-7]|uniref:NADH-quinone oxidoreductase subunit J n=1 Tax=Arcticibacter svalbardensis MN12-7 TaxID=1150600 RepID=R9GWR4_9SPHI|nr:NADH-quinone oxidoreductase subunit J [Arcticibacter svalbardensis]EOR96247.1 NADH-ubiquinone oxidoreductase chain J [Arcticibacter svalbardensis MN12-7]
MNIEQIVFYFFAASVLLSAFMVVFIKNMVRSIFLFFVTLFSMAGLFVFALADFIAVTQLIVYVGGMLVLMIFAFLLSSKTILNKSEVKESNLLGLHHIPGLFIALLFFLILFITIYQANPDQLSWVNNSENVIQVNDNTIHFIGVNLMTRYLIPFEIISVLLMMALIGASHLARREKKI